MNFHINNESVKGLTFGEIKKCLHRGDPTEAPAILLPIRSEVAPQRCPLSYGTAKIGYKKVMTSKKAVNKI